MQAVEALVVEHRIYATCLSLDPLGLALVKDNWQRMYIQATALLLPLQPSPEFVKRFDAASQQSRLLDTHQTLAATQQYCQAHQAEISRFYSFGFGSLAQAIDAVLHPKPVD